MKTMNAAYIEKPGELSVGETAIPSIGPGDVLINVTYCGVCQTDVGIFRGLFSQDLLPLIPGHEFSGIIAAVGQEVRGIDIGDSVAADINIGCGDCDFCVSDRILACKGLKQVGIHRNGGFAEYVAVPASKVVKLPRWFDLKAAALTEPCANILRAFRKSGLNLGGSCCVIGSGCMALLAAAIARLRGAVPVVFIGTDKESEGRAEGIGADSVFSFEPNVNERVRNVVLNGAVCDGFDVVVQVSDDIAAYKEAVELTAPGGTLVAFGLAAPGKRFSFSAFDFVISESAVIGTDSANIREMRAAVRLLAYGRINADDFICGVRPLSDIERALLECEAGTLPGKILIRIH